jgi:parallel beta-helix repeat protein
LEISTIAGKIRITNDSGWVDFKNAGNCTGEGTYSNPYVIEDLIIDPGRWVTCIIIENSDVYFRIEDCSLVHSGGSILLSNISNSLIIANNCSSNDSGINLWSCNNTIVSGNIADFSNHFGINLYDCHNTTVSGNSVNNNDMSGIRLWHSHGNNVSGNTANNNYESGIFLASCDNVIISGNTANNNKYGIYLSYSHYNTVSGNAASNNKRGIYLDYSDYNTISGNNLVGNDECIVEVNCEGNILENNDCGIIPGYNLFFLLGALSVAVILISKKLKKL